jgi:hypothetical protein
VGTSLAMAKLPPLYLDNPSIQFSELLSTLNPNYAPRVLSWGAGYDSTALLLAYCQGNSETRKFLSCELAETGELPWLLEYLNEFGDQMPDDFRDFPLENLIVVHSVLGGEAKLLQQQIEQFLFPLLRMLGVWVIQCCRNSDYRQDGITILDSSRSPERFYRRGTYTLFDHLIRNGVVPQRGGKGRLCTIKFKGWVIDSVVQALFDGTHIQRFVGYNADEAGRAKKECWGEDALSLDYEYILGFNADEHSRTHETPPSWRPQVFRFPLIEQGWGRRWVEDRLNEFAGFWKKSYCNDCCPFPECNGKGRKTGDHGDLRQDWLDEPLMGARAAIVELIAMAINENQPLFEKVRVIDILKETANIEAIQILEDWLGSQEWAVYQVRRIFVEASEPGKKAPAPYRETKILSRGTKAQMCQKVAELSGQPVEVNSIWSTPRVVLLERPTGKKPPRPFAEACLVI